MSATYYDQESETKVNQCKSIVTFDNTPESKILDASNILILSNLQKSWTIACKDTSRVFEIEYSTYCILNRSELCECSLTAGNYLLSQTIPNAEICQKLEMATSLLTMPLTRLYWTSSQ